VTHEQEIEMLREIIIPPTHLDKLSGSNFQRTLDNLENAHKATWEAVQAKDQETNDDDTQDAIPDEPEQDEELTPLEKALIQRLGQPNDT
jgi:hypothetical protein